MRDGAVARMRGSISQVASTRAIGVASGAMLFTSVPGRSILSTRDCRSVGARRSDKRKQKRKRKLKLKRKRKRFDSVGA